jgi:hypothetical protein
VSAEDGVEGRAVDEDRKTRVAPFPGVSLVAILATAVIWKTLLVAEPPFCRLDWPELVAQVSGRVASRCRESSRAARQDQGPPLNPFTHFLTRRSCLGAPDAVTLARGDVG